MEDDECCDHEQDHRGQRVARPQLEPQVLPSERGDVGEVRGHIRSSSSRAGASGARPGRDRGSTPPTVWLAGQRGELVVEQRRPLRVERRVGLVEDQERRLVQQGAAEGEPLGHPARVRRRRAGAGIPEAEALEEHPDALAALAHAIETAVQVEVLERRQLTVDERLVPDEPDPGARHGDLERAPGRRREPGEQAEQGRLAGAVRSRDDERATGGNLEREVPEHGAAAVALLERPRPDDGLRHVPPTPSPGSHWARAGSGEPSEHICRARLGNRPQGHPRCPDVTLSRKVCRMGAGIVPEVATARCREVAVRAGTPRRSPRLRALTGRAAAGVNHARRLKRRRRADSAQSSVSSATNTPKATDRIPLRVKNAASSLRRSSGRTITCS